MEKAPWVRRNRINGRIEKFEEHKWQVVEAGVAMSRLELKGLGFLFRDLRGSNRVYISSRS